MARRTHKKSRNGCLECKRRHVKCDETRPVCSNCVASERECQYASRFPNVDSEPSLGSSSSPATPIDEPSPAPVTPPVSDDQPVNMLHVELLNNLYTNTYDTFDPHRALPWLSEVFITSITTPYLANALLGFSSLHLSALRPHQRDFYRYHAAQLQTHALAIFNETTPKVSQDTCVPLFLLASTLGVHVLCDTLIYREGDFDHFLSRFVHHLRLHKGVRTVVSQAASFLLESPAKAAFGDGFAMYKFVGRLGPACANLLAMVQAANLGDEFTEIYKQAIETLQACTNVAENPRPDYAAVNGVTTWPVIINIEFSNHLEKRRPEALVILAHYAVLLHWHRECWLFADSGRFIIETVTQYLGDPWHEWLQWPLQVLQS